MTTPDPQPPMPSTEESLLQFFKVLGQTSRLKVAGMLAIKAYTIAELANLLRMKEREVGRTVAMLQKASLVVEGKSAGTFQLNQSYLETLNRQILSPLKDHTPAPELEGGEEWQQKVLQNFFMGEKLKEIPIQPKKFLVILQWFVQKFEMDKQYTEKEVNELIKHHHADFAQLRRGMVDFGLMARDKGLYWRINNN